MSSVTFVMLNGDEFTKSNLNEDQLQRLMIKYDRADRWVDLELDLGEGLRQRHLIMVRHVSSIRIVSDESGIDSALSPA